MKKIFSILALLLCVGALNAQQLDRSVRPSAAPAKEIQINDAKTFTLANGLKVFVVEDNRAPIVYYSIALDIKPALEGSKAGAESLLSTVIGTATTTRTKEQLNKEIDLIGASISATSRGASGNSLKKYEAKMLDLMSDMLLHPKFNQSELDLNVNKAKSGLAMIGDDAGSICDRVSAALSYGSSYPSGEVETIKTIESVQIADLQKFYATYFAPNVARLVIVGNITEAEAKKNAEKYFGKWQKKNVPVTSYTIPQAPAETKVAMVSKDGAVQSAINVTYPLDYKPGAPDAEAVSIMNTIFGGGSSSRLFQNLREQHSYTYGVYSSVSNGELVGSFSISSGRGAASIKGAATDSALYQFMLEMNRITSAPVSAEELKQTKALLAGNFGRSLENPAAIARFAINIDKYKLPKDYYKNYLKRLDAVTIADVQAAAKKYIKPNNAWVVVVGDKSLANGLKQLAANKTVQFYNIDAQPVEAPVAKAANVSAESIINKYVDALGGKAAIEKVNSYKMLADANAMGQKLQMVQVFKKPNQTSLSFEMGGMVAQKMVFNGSTLKMSGMQGSSELKEGAMFEDAKAQASICPELDYLSNGYQLVVNGIEKVGDKDAYVLAATKDGRTITTYFDTATGLKLKVASIVDTPQGPMPQVMEYGDYRAVDGVKFSYSMKQAAGGMSIPITVTSVEVNKLTDDSAFK